MTSRSDVAGSSIGIFALSMIGCSALATELHIGPKITLTCVMLSSLCVADTPSAGTH